MNKILLVEDNNKFSSGNYILEYNKNTNLELNGIVKINCLSTYDTNINILDNSQVEIQTIWILNKDIDITINIKNNSNIILNTLIINEGNNKVVLNVNMQGNNSLAKIKLRAINKQKDSKLDIICNGNIVKNTINNELLEDLKGLLTSEDTIKISPNMRVSTNEVVANHLVTIGAFNQEELFYLTTKGLSIEQAKKILIEAFTTNFISEDFKEIVKMEVRNIE